jgi:uncharacterized protein YggU (UPF0235/DUF167 family)
MGAAWSRRAAGIEIVVRVTPRGGRDALGPGSPGQFAARLAAAPVDGAANEALVALVARAFGVPRRDVTLAAGKTSRVKRLAIAGDSEALAERAHNLYGAVP